jgi:hypothetical protein
MKAKANELRLGNWLQRADGSTFKVTADDIKIIDTWKNPFAPLPDYVPLTEEWLITFGADETGYIGLWLSVRPLITALQGRIEGKWYVSQGGSLPHTITNNIMYVHQLQNLYFALTSEELTPQTNPK